MSTFKPPKPTTKAEKATRTTLDTLELTPALVESWMLPAFQREKRVNERVRAIAEQIAEDDGVVPGVLTLGILDGKTYLIDGQHRREAFLLSKCRVGYGDVRTHYFSTMAEMGEEFVKLNSQIVRLRPDDILRGLEQSSPGLANLRKECPFIGYDYIRRNESSPLVSMSLVLRAWRGSAPEAPTSGVHGMSAAGFAQCFALEDSHALVGFMKLAFASWGRDESYARLWQSLNLIMTMWIYRRLVLTQYSHKTQRISPEQFSKCLMSLSANSPYLDWIVGRRISDRDRTPAYNRIKAIFIERIQQDTGKRIYMPAPGWST